MALSHAEARAAGPPSTSGTGSVRSPDSVSTDRTRGSPKTASSAARRRAAAGTAAVPLASARFGRMASRTIEARSIISSRAPAWPWFRSAMNLISMAIARSAASSVDAAPHSVCAD
jgi:hypothetical protein